MQEYLPTPYVHISYLYQAGVLGCLGAPADRLAPAELPGQGEGVRMMMMIIMEMMMKNMMMMMLLMKMIYLAREESPREESGRSPSPLLQLSNTSKTNV